ncbi:hypothetical protein GCM10011507_08220 [Edaphobacter acidisoli]|uniref:Uncharacterized protein n=1 Tax=Edaphobacter acidisoli TaxID=2040573 RepID=A0A916RJT3_9BACT|nr:hypothetical protein [Edaphobacter acidisoli]GGA59178.1 hypothetical protein GCM10011507_08220 [Edaphobacter acidisoli]
MSSAHKKVIVRRTTNETLPGYLPLSGFVHAGSVPLLDLEGRVIPINLNDIKHVCYVRDFNLNDSANPERLTRRTFLARPRAEGLWVRMTFRAGDVLEGLAATDLSLADDLIHDAGLFVTPPDTRSNTQRVYVPRIALSELQLVAVITAPSRKKPLPALPSLQEDLFNSMVPPNTRPN